MEILRYRLAQDFRGQPCMVEDAAGAFVAFRDIQPHIEELEKLRDKNAQIKAIEEQ
jgi:hypothetical protein